MIKKTINCDTLISICSQFKDDNFNSSIPTDLQDFFLVSHQKDLSSIPLTLPDGKRRVWSSFKAKKAKIRILIIILIVFIFQSNGNCVPINISGVALNKNVKNLKQIRQENVVTQSLDFSCGAAGLSTLLNYYLGDNVTENEIITELLKTVSIEKVRERNGFSLLDLKSYAQQRGYIAKGYKMDFKYLKEIKIPVMVPIKFKNYKHFVIIKGVIGDRVFIADPAVGNMSIKISKFKTMWPSGIGFTIERAEDDNHNSYALNVKIKDLRLTNLDAVKRSVNPSSVRTTIFANEW